MNAPVFSDLACESELTHDAGKHGAVYTEERAGAFTLSRLHVQNEEGERRTKKRIGRYTTILSPQFDRLTEAEAVELSSLLAKELLREILHLLPHFPQSILIAGLGNRALTADAFGPLTVERLTVTRHLAILAPEVYRRFCKAEVGAVSVGVPGQTGVESADFLRGLITATQPALLIVLDALAARSTARLGATVQISDSGIFPGSGVGNRRSEISRDSMQIPVLSIGIPTVVNSAVLVHDALKDAGCAQDLCETAAHRIEGNTFFVSQKEIDRIAECGADVVAAALHKLYLKQDTA